MDYVNPIIPGFNPDPSICRKGKDYYLVTSTFEFFPGVPVYHSTDLINWELVGHCLTRRSQLDLEGIRYSKGIYAPTIRYNPHDDLFYMVTTNVTKIENFYVTAKDPAGEWSEPVLVEQGGIDPSLFFEDDGSAHFISNYRDRNVKLGGFHMAPIDTATGKFLRPATPLWGGTGANAPEAPHVYKINGWYYQLIAEGGTELGHMVTIARSRELYGTYEPCPMNPILTHKDQKGALIQGTGHADLIEDADGNWWAFFLGFRQTHQYFHHLGRETFLAPVNWVDGWPLINNKEPISVKMSVPVKNNVVQKRSKNYFTDFKNGKLLDWVFLRNPDMDDYSFSGEGLGLRGNLYNLSDVANPAFQGFRQRDLSSVCEIDLSFAPKLCGEEAGFSVFYKYDAHVDVFVTLRDNARYLCLRKVVGNITHLETQIPLREDKITIVVKSNPLSYDFFAKIGGGEVYLGEALTRFVSTEAHELGFTGTFYALYASGNGKRADSTALFTRFDYKGLD